LLLVLLALLSARLQAQQTVRDSLYYAGTRDGTAAGATAPAGGIFAPAFLSGLPIGFFGLFVITRDAGASNVPVVFAGGGLTGVILTSAGASRKSGALSHELQQQISSQDTVYQRAFRDAYSRRLYNRLQGRVLGGALAGMATGFLGLIMVLSHIDGT
jgi:hypothetical protein